MKNSILLLALAIAPQFVKAQCGPPPPPALSVIYSVDLDNDGLAPFDIGYYITNVQRPNLEELYGVSSSGYDIVYTNSSGEPTGLNYTTDVPDEIVTTNITYNGSGPQFAFSPPCYWPIGMNGGLRLTAVPFDGDFDDDGIPNALEDSNGNMNLMDDDFDNDGIINLEDANDLMSVSNFSDLATVIFPNPASGVFHVQSLSAISKVSISDLSGKTVVEYNSPSSEIAIEHLSKGIYMVKIESDKSTTLRKLIVE